MPLQDRQDFRDWLEQHTAQMVGRRHGDPNVCTSCGNDLAHRLDTTECLVCLAEQFGTDTAELHLAEAIGAFVALASDPPALAQMLGSAIAQGRELAEIHAP